MPKAGSGTRRKATAATTVANAIDRVQDKTTFKATTTGTRSKSKASKLLSAPVLGENTNPSAFLSPLSNEHNPGGEKSPAGVDSTSSTKNVAPKRAPKASTNEQQQILKRLDDILMNVKTLRERVDNLEESAQSKVEAAIDDLDIDFNIRWTMDGVEYVQGAISDLTEECSKEETLNDVVVGLAQATILMKSYFNRMETKQESIKDRLDRIEELLEDGQ